jgi:phage terminase large subunit
VVFGTTDWGFRPDPSVLQIWGLDEDGELWLIEEDYRTGVHVELDPRFATKDTPMSSIERAHDMSRRHGVTLWVAAKDRPEHIDTFNRAGLATIPMNNDRALGIQEMQNRVAMGPGGRPRIHILRDALMEQDHELLAAGKPTCTADEPEGWVWKDVREGMRNDKAFTSGPDHGMDGMRAACMYARELIGADPGAQRPDDPRPRLRPGILTGQRASVEDMDEGSLYE